MIDRSDPIALACHIPCELECARLERELAEVTVDRDRWIARVKWLEHLLDGARKLLR